jgi:hypothetical protein
MFCGCIQVFIIVPGVEGGLYGELQAQGSACNVCTVVLSLRASRTCGFLAISATADTNATLSF